MKGYQKLAVFIVVLLLSVSLLSTAIDILGDISDVDLDEELRTERAVGEPGKPVDAERDKGESLAADEGPSGDVQPLFEIQYPPRTKYLRRTVLEEYLNGEWFISEDSTALPYNGEEIPLNISGYDAVESVDFLIIPLVELNGFLPVTLSVYHLDFIGQLERYPNLEAFSSPEAFHSNYGINYNRYEFSEAALRAAELRHPKKSLEIPEDLSDKLKPLALEVVGDASTPWQKLKAIEGYLKSNYDYDTEFEPAPPDIDPVEWFLFHDTRGVCTHFNSAFVLLARSIDIPARIVNGFLVAPDVEEQFVMPKHAHVYAEVPFKQLGWIAFDATPERTEERPAKITRIPTITNITDNDRVGIKGGNFNVYGTVTTYNGSAVDGLSVEVFLKLSKNETGVRCGFDSVSQGFFNITCDASPDLEVGDYMLVAHTLGNAIYEESWSDPPIRIMAKTELILEAPRKGYTGESITIRGKLLDSSNGQPLSNRKILVEIDGEVHNHTTDSKGSITLTRLFEEEGNKTVTFTSGDSEYYLGSSKAVIIPVNKPPFLQRLLGTLTSFPYNLILVSLTAVLGTTIIMVRRKGSPPLPQSEEEILAPEGFDDEWYLNFTSYKEGIVKLFNHFYAYSRRRYKEIQPFLTPREFQQLLLVEIPDSGARALDDIVTSFEIANYSEVYSTEEEYQRCRAGLEFLKELIENGERGKEENST